MYNWYSRTLREKDTESTGKRACSGRRAHTNSSTLYFALYSDDDEDDDDDDDDNVSFLSFDVMCDLVTMKRNKFGSQLFKNI